MECKININAIDDVLNMTKSALRNNYTVTIKQIYNNGFWKQEIDQYEITFFKDDGTDMMKNED